MLPTAWDEMCFMVNEIRNVEKKSSSEIALFHFMQKVDFSRDFAEQLRAECHNIWDNLLHEAVKQKKEAQH